ncbi:hypothetical protein [Jiulongibacter sp. NS-SX5]|uniref:hypothetical protein n=1 Tax=Jiulongibacter sp. NS-SX5 TaxID=3463854 RepID=UPI00405A3D93
MNNKQLFDETAAAVAEVTRDGVKYFQGAIRKSGLILTEHLYNSVEGVVVEETAGLGMEIHFDFAEYWRYLDMKRLEYSTAPNVEAMMEWGSKIPVRQIPWVSGYEGQSASTVAAKIGEDAVRERFVNSVLAYRRKVPTVVHNNKKRLYNKTKAAFMNVLRIRLMEKLGKRIPLFVSEQMALQY